MPQKRAQRAAWYGAVWSGVERSVFGQLARHGGMVIMTYGGIAG